jgi:UDP-N-acetylglucosamine acyltransferase
VASDDGAVDPALIGRLLPHRYPLLLVDRVVGFEDGQRLVARKTVTVDEPFFAGHFPGRPVLPGVLICEAMTQAAALLIARSAGALASDATLAIAGLERARFRRSVLPGDVLELEVRAVDRRPPRWRLRGVARVDGVVAGEADFTAVEREADAARSTAAPASGGAAASTDVHPTAVVAPGAELAAGVRVGPYSVIGPHARIGAGTSIGPHVVVDGRTTIGRDNRIFQFASIGAEPQDLKYRGEESRLEIGDRNIIREFATLNTGTAGGGMVTRLGSDSLLMNYAHIGHDCSVGSHCVLANGATLAGHVTVEDYVIVGGLAAIHQFVRVGESALLGGGAMVIHDVPPYCNASGDRARLRGINVIGLKRRGFDAARVRTIKQAYRLLFTTDRPFADACAAAAAELGDSPEVARMLAFVGASKRGITPTVRRDGGGADED